MSKVKKIKIFILSIIFLILLPTGINFILRRNTDWLGFWGSYLGSIISIYGVYWSVWIQNKNALERERREHKNALEREKREQRPYVNYVLQNTLIYVNGEVEIWHSKQRISDKDINGVFIRVSNPTNNLAIELIVVVYDNKGQIHDMIVIPNLINKYVLVDFRDNLSPNISKIEISFKTIRGEVGLYSKSLNESNIIKDGYTSWGKHAIKQRQDFINKYNNHNKKTDSDKEFKYLSTRITNKDIADMRENNKTFNKYNKNP